MPISALPQAPYRQDRRTFPTPLVTDVLFSEIRDGNMHDFPLYGTPHPNKDKWPYHKLIFIKPVDIERNQIFQFFYAADRENQDLYNFSSGYRNVIGNVGGREFRVVLREYVTLRDEFDPLFPEFGTPMPNVPEGTFDNIEYVFFDKQQKKMDQAELDSLYVAEVRTYIERAFLDEKLSFSAERPILTPERFRATLPTVVTEEIVEGKASLPVPTGDQISISEDQINPDIKRVRTVSRSTSEDDVTLVGTRAYVEQTVASTTETYSQSELTAEEGLLVVQSQVTPLGDGSYIRETVTVNEWPELVGSDWDNNVKAQVRKIQQFVDPPSEADLYAQDTSFTPVTKDRFLRVTETVPYEVVAGYFMTYSSTVDINLPNVLRSVEVIWSADNAVGTYESNWDGSAIGNDVSLSGSERGEANGSASQEPEVLLDIEYPWGQDCPINIHVFYVKPTENAYVEGQYTAGSFVSSDLVISKLMEKSPYRSSPSGMKRWPVFKPQSHRIITNAKRVNVSAQCNGSFSYAKSDQQEHRDSTSGSGFSVAVDTTINVTNVPPTLHPLINLSDAADRYVVASASCSVQLPFGGSANSNASSPSNIFASVNPKSLSATYPQDIPRSGYYLLRYQSEPYKWGWHRVTASVIDASLFAR